MEETDAIIVFTMMKGMSFRPAEAKAAYNSLEPGEEVTLQRDKENKYDPNAVQVWGKDEHGENHFVAFVAKEEALVVANYLDAGYTYNARVVLRPNIEIEFYPPDTADA